MNEEVECMCCEHSFVIEEDDELSVCDETVMECPHCEARLRVTRVSYLVSDLES